MPRVSACRSDAGFTLVELLVVVLLLGVVGGIVTSGLVSAMQNTRASQARIEAMAELQRGAERITREFRAACPVMSMGSEQVVVGVVRGGETQYHEFYRDGQDRLRHAIKDTAEAPPDGGTVLLNDLADYGADELFTFLGPDGNPATEERRVRVAVLTLRRDLPEQDQPVEVTTSTSLRNGGRACD
jgi:prepilin-type N-terminal cleavage/methylation domain-containing protein